MHVTVAADAEAHQLCWLCNWARFVLHALRTRPLLCTRPEGCVLLLMLRA